MGGTHKGGDTMAELGQWIAMQDALHSAFSTIVRVRAELKQLRNDMAAYDDSYDVHMTSIAEVEGRLMRAIEDMRAVRTHMDLAQIDRIHYAD